MRRCRVTELLGIFSYCDKQFAYFRFEGISQLRNEVGEAHGSVTKNVTNKDQKLRQVIDDAHDAIEYVSN